jgi:dipeptidyl-peptidase-4
MHAPCAAIDYLAKAISGYVASRALRFRSFFRKPRVNLVGRPYRPPEKTMLDSRLLILLVIGCVWVADAQSDDQAAVLDIERLFASPDLDGPSPNSVKISPDSRRVTFLRGKETDRLQQDLWEYDVEDGETRLLVDSEVLVAGPEELSEEELARRERLRIVGQRGIVDYHFSPDGRSLLFPLNGDLFLYEIPTGRTRNLTRTEAGETDPKFSPKGAYVSFVREQNLFVIELESGREIQLTSDGGGPIRNGMAEFIAQEEMKRFTGYWWSRDERTVAFTRVDESPVVVVERFEVYADEFQVYQQRYPETGTPNAVVRLGVVDLDDGATRWLDLGENEDIYLARVDWFPDSRHLAVQRQSRDQKTLDLLKFSVADGNHTVLLTETSDTWINLHDELEFLETRDEFIWASARTGHKHLYLYRDDGELIRPLTDGEWEVVFGGRGNSAVQHVDEDRGLVYFSGNREGPTERHVYVVPLDGSAAPERLSERPGWHRAEFARNGAFFVDMFDSVSTPPQVALHKANGTRIAFIQQNRLDQTHPFYPYLRNQASTEFGTLEAEDGQLLFYRIRKPADFDPRRRYPVIVYVYGGPGVLLVRNTWNVSFLDVLAANGYIVFTLDNRGSADRGVAFESPIYRHMGDVEVIDQVTGAEYLRSLPYVDGERIGIFGWSYGGYMALMCMFRAADVFAAGVSGAPVTDWALYDTHYTERYLGTPQDNPEGYRASGVFPYAEGLRGPLLVIHGMADDNVLFTNSTKLFKALQDGGLDFDMMTYPGSKHALLRVPATGRHGYAQILRFFNLHLKPARLDDG